MIKYIDTTTVIKKIDLPDGLSLVLLDRLAKEKIYGQLACARNIFLVDSAQEKIVWQVQTDFDLDGGSFTNIFMNENKIQGYRWDGGLYAIDSASGKGIPSLLIK